jgi:hypothetical protein
MKKQHYVLKRGAQWICAPSKSDPRAVFCNGLYLGGNRKQAWKTKDLDIAIERSAVLRAITGWASTVTAISV